jgi:hypothetical protein
MRGNDQKLADLSTHLANRGGDKLAKWCVMGVQGAIGARVMDPIYISSIVIGKTGENDDPSKDAFNLRCYLKVK